MNENNNNYTTPFDAGEYDYLFDKTKPITDKIISLWLNGYSINRIANRLDCTIELVNQTVDKVIYHLTEVK